MLKSFENDTWLFTSSSITPHSRLGSALSVESNSTVIPHNGGFGGQLKQLCSLIESHPTLQNAQIISVECFSESIFVRIHHRFLILELEREGKKNIWLRLDRRRAKIDGTIKFLRGRGTTRANDTVRL